MTFFTLLSNKIQREIGTNGNPFFQPLMKKDGGHLQRTSVSRFGRTETIHHIANYGRAYGT
jgi:hypothetical protein